MKVIMLDIDGVLNTQRNFGEQWSSKCCDNLNSILERVSDAKIVISSSWRMWGIDYMKDVLKKNGIDPNKIIGLTGHEHTNRGQQIQYWLDRNPGVTNMVILDDNTDMAPLVSNLVKTNSFVGLTSKEADEAVEMLKKPI